MSTSLSVISSMATRQLLAELGQAYQQRHGVRVEIESVGGVDAAGRVKAGEVFDLVVLASDAIATLMAAGCLRARSSGALVDSEVVMAVPAAATPPDVRSQEALRNTLAMARSIGYSTGPSGKALMQLFERWGLAEALKHKLVQARPGMPVGKLIASGEVDLGFQQRSEMMNLEGVTVLGGMPPGLEIVSRFVGAVGAASPQPDAARALLAFMCAADQSALKQRHGMVPARLSTQE